MKIKLNIEGMSCGHCVNHVKEALKELSQVQSVEVNLEEKYAIVESEKDIEASEFKTAIDEAGYTLVKVEAL